VLQGCCEHLLTFSDVRLLHPDDPQHTSAYPELVYQVLGWMLISDTDVHPCWHLRCP
jgi:snRNA-activating protein complex (SNAPc), subunit 3